MIKAVFFDLDDTLFDQTHSSREALISLQSYFPDLKKISIDKLWEIHNNLLNSVHTEYVLSGKMSIEQARFIRFKELFNLVGGKSESLEYKQAADMYREVYLKERTLVAGAIELLDAIHNKFKLAILSNNEHQEQINKLQHLEILDYFDEVITSEIAGSKKPEMEIFVYALNRLNIKNEEAILIGDNWETDILGAINAGIKAIWFNRHGLEKHKNLFVPEIKSLVPAELIVNLIY